MALENRDHELVGSTNTGQEKDGILKKKRSLTRLFISRARTPTMFQAGQTSSHTPYTPKGVEIYVPSSPLPLQKPFAGPAVPMDYAGKSEVHQNPWRMPSEALPEIDNCAGRPNGKVPGTRRDVQPATGIHPADCRAVQNDLTGRTWIAESGRDRLRQSSLPLLHRKSYGSVQTPAAASKPGLQDLSASLRKANTAPSKASPARPKTAVDKVSQPTGNIWFHEPVKALPSEFAPRRPNLWRRKLGREEKRGSFRSALSHTSSGVDAPSTGRSSTITRSTSLTDSSVEIYETSNFKDTITVDDAIDMYVAGFADDPTSEDEVVKDSCMTDEERRRSVRIAEAINDSIGSELLRGKRPATSTSNSSAAIMSGAAFRDCPDTPSILFPTSTRDEYGFLKASHHITIEQYEAWKSPYVRTQERRNVKWQSYMRKCSLTCSAPETFPQRCAKTQRHIRKGVPPAWRGAAWFHYAGGKAYLEKYPNLYETLLARSGTSELSEHDKEIIERDLHRTFPDNTRFKPDRSPTSNDPTALPLLTSLRNVLRAFSLHAPKIGYCQSLNFICGLLLLFLPEAKAFWMLHIITSDYLPGTHEVSLEGANVDLWVLMLALKERLPSVWAKVAAGGSGTRTSNLGTKLPPISLCTTSWFMSLFIGTLPVESVLRVWDILFYEGSKTIFLIALAIFRIGEQHLKSLTDSVEMFQVVQSLPRGLLDVGLLMDVAFRRGGVSQDWVEKKRGERRQWHIDERTELSKVVIPDARPEEGQTAKPRRADSLWRRRRK